MVVPAAVLLSRFQEKVAKLRATLDHDEIRGEAAGTLSTSIKSVTAYPAGEHGPGAEVVAKVSDLIAYAANENSPERGRAGGCSLKLVAGTGFEPVTFRL
jgi:site-specific DNA recombinase